MIMFNGSTGGLGDLCAMGWLVRGAIDAGQRACVAVHGGHAFRAGLLDRFGIPNAVHKDGVPHGAIEGGGAAHYYHFEIQNVHGERPRLEAWGRYQNPPIVPARPAYRMMPGDEDIAAEVLRRAGGRRVAVVFPECEWTGRAWLKRSFSDLTKYLSERGFYVCTLAQARSKDFLPYVHGDYWWGHPFAKVVAVMAVADVVVGCDSAPVWYAGTIGTRAVALMGPTRNVFGGMQNVVEVAAPRDRVSCSGCYFGHPYSNLCDQSGCRALFSIQPEEVATVVVEQTTTEESREWKSRVLSGSLERTEAGPASSAASSRG